MLPSAVVKAVAVLKYPGTATATPGVSTLKPEITIYFQTDSRAANAVLRVVGPVLGLGALHDVERLGDGTAVLVGGPFHVLISDVRFGHLPVGQY